MDKTRQLEKVHFFCAGEGEETTLPALMEVDGGNYYLGLTTESGRPMRFHSQDEVHFEDGERIISYSRCITYP